MINNAIHQYLYFMVFVLFTFIGIQQLTFRKKLQLNYFLAILFWAGAYNMLYFWAYDFGIQEKIPLLINTEIVVSFLVGPCLYLYFSALMGRNDIPARILLLHGLPFLVSLILLVGMNLFYPALNATFGVAFQPAPDYSYNTTVFIFNTLCDLSIALYFLAALIRTIFLIKGRKVTVRTMLIILYLVSFSLSAILMLIANFTGNTALLQISFVFISAIATSFIIFSFRNPDYAIKVISETRGIRKSKARDKIDDIEERSASITRQMREKTFYRQPDITLQSLSRQLSVKPHELSYILNNVLMMNFNSYINSFRIEEAKSLLLQKGSMNVTEIAFHVGFNSTSSFYRSFVKETGVPPKEFMKGGTGPA